MAVQKIADRCPKKPNRLTQIEVIEYIDTHHRSWGRYAHPPEPAWQPAVEASVYRHFPTCEIGMFSAAWKMLKDTVLAFINDEALNRGAAIAFYTVTSIGPVLLLVVAIAGLVFGQDAARGAVVTQLSGLMGQQSADLLQNTIKRASGKSSGIFASALGVIT